ncbi:transposase [Patescibacteria group bacterium]|nr:transposase [Patescibacteria group bacterium]
MRQLREFYKEGFWHIFNRGVAKQNIFQKRDDFIFYLYKTKEVLKKYPVTIYSYNLLANHLHYLIKQNSEITPSKFIGNLHSMFGMYVNRKYSRVGPLFQGRFKANPLEESALLSVSFYINLNKVLEKLEHLEKSKISIKDLDRLLEEAEKDPWTSYPVYLGLRKDGITQTKFILSLLSDDIKKAREEYRKMAREFILSGYFLKTRDLLFEEKEQI